MKKTVVIGTTFVDVKGFPFNTYDPQGRNLGSIRIVHGGVGRNVVENFANVGMPVSYVGMLEDSAFGIDVERHLRKIGADLTYMVKAPENGMGMWMVILDENGNLAGSISKMPDISYLDAYLEEHGDEIIQNADTVVLEVDLNEHIAEMVVDLAKKYQKKIYAIVGNLSVVLARKDLIRKIDCFICNEVEAAKYFSDETLLQYSTHKMAEYLFEAVPKDGLQAMVVTMGEQGAAYYDAVNDLEGVMDAYPVKVVDTSGAGDAFFSGTVMALNRDIPLPEALKFGAKLASATIGHDETTCPVDKQFFVD